MYQPEIWYGDGQCHKTDCYSKWSCATNFCTFCRTWSTETWMSCYRSGHSFAQTMTAELSWFVQNCDLIMACAKLWPNLPSLIQKQHYVLWFGVLAHKLFVGWVLIQTRLPATDYNGDPEYSLVSVYIYSQVIYNRVLHAVQSLQRYDAGGRFKNAYELLNLRVLKIWNCIKIISFNVLVRYFVWNFKGTLWFSTQNI